MTATTSALLQTAVQAARRAGKLQREGLYRRKRINEIAAHDIKLEMDVVSQRVITETLMRKFPNAALLGEEGAVENPGADFRWVVDPLDGTANYFNTLPIFAVSIAWQRRIGKNWRTDIGVVYDPMQDELFTATRGGPALLNGRRIRVANRWGLQDTMMVIGIFKDKHNINRAMKLIRHFVHHVRKLRHLGSAAIDACWVACGRLDAYLEPGVKIWDVAAGALIIERAGGIAPLEPTSDPNTWNIWASSRAIRPVLERELRKGGVRL